MIDIVGVTLILLVGVLLGVTDGVVEHAAPGVLV